MARFEEFEASSLDEALAAAERQLGVPRAELTYDVLRSERGLFGVSERAVVIRVRAPELESEPTPEAEAPSAETSIEEQAPVAEEEAAVEAPPAELRDASSDDDDEDEDEVQGDAEDEGYRDDEEGDEEEDLDPGEPDPAANDVERLIADLLDATGLDLEYTFAQRRRDFVVDVSGPDRDLLLEDGPAVLDSLQFLATLMVRKSYETHRRIRFESEDYRERRDEEVREMALEAAAEVGLGRPFVRLPSMNPYERRIVHITLNDDPTVTSESEGGGFYKRVKVTSANRPRGGGRRGGRGRGRGGERGGERRSRGRRR